MPPAEAPPAFLSRETSWRFFFWEQKMGDCMTSVHGVDSREACPMEIDEADASGRVTWRGGSLWCWWLVGPAARCGAVLSTYFRGQSVQWYECELARSILSVGLVRFRTYYKAQGCHLRLQISEADYQAPLKQQPAVIM